MSVTKGKIMKKQFIYMMISVLTTSGCSNDSTNSNDRMLGCKVAGCNTTPFLLFDAIENGDIKLVKKALEEEDVNEITDEYARKALMVASLKGDPEIVQLLLDAGAEVNATNSNGETALKLASREGHTRVIELLKKAGAVHIAFSIKFVLKRAFFVLFLEVFA